MEKKTPINEDHPVKIILLGDSAVGKSKLVERFLMDGFYPQQQSTFALTLFRYDTERDDEKVPVDFWDTAGQERFNNIHQSYYFGADCCILVFDITRKQTYKNLEMWYKELTEIRTKIPCIIAANKIDIDMDVVHKTFNFANKRGLELQFVSASEGTNVVKLFNRAIDLAVEYRKNPPSDELFDTVRDLLNEDSDDDGQ
eukprot:TRINITY_DN66444_c8_g1_i1.p2 TRINITY_DN66444_c8_g1~~TRINITY_DN66444_c8_g1_i1.p2  ORF type:complete len:199 (-),score=23.07 TRINITY_DN66444_c8_g1_i1:1329-1925(-)